jgi:phosphohistidine swiveling domain-containing protein
MTQTKEHAAHFRISGADFTRIARERLLEDAPGHAWRIATCLGNDSGEDRDSGVADIALGILKGTKKLVGNESDMRAVKEHAKVTKVYQAQINALYAGRIRIGDKWYRPVAYVTSCGPRDMKNDHGMPVHRKGSNRGYENRAWHYCGKDEIVVDNAGYPDPEFPRIKREVIFRTCGERPHWMDVPLTPQAALDEYLVVHGLEERSHAKWYGDKADEIWAGADDEDIDTGSQALQMRGERIAREQTAIKNGDLTPMNARINAELELARELDEDDRPEIQALRDDPQRGEMIKRAYKKGLGVGVMAEMLDEMDPTALAKLKPETAHEIEAERLREDYRLAQEITDEAAREEAEDQIDAEREALRLRRLADLRVVILKQAGDDLLDLSWNVVMNHDNTEVRVPAGAVKVPRAPFLHWAFARMKMFEEQLPPWQTVCPPGMKMMNDDPYHTDWVVGAGLDPDDRSLLYYPGPVADAAMQLAHELQDKFDKPSPIHVLVDGPHAIGPVHHGKRKKPCPAGAIVVLPNLHPDYVITIEDAVGVITEEGGAVAHLAQVGRERNLPIVRIENALKRFAPDEQIVIDTASRSVTGL